jgi:hypothetical protein
MSYEVSVSYFKRLENLKRIRCTNSWATPSLDDKKSVTSSLCKSSKNPKASDMWCDYCDKNNHKTADCRSNTLFKEKKKKLCFEAQAESGKNVLVFLF